MSDPTQVPERYTEALVSWREDSAVPTATGDRLALDLTTLRGLGAVRRQVQAFLLSSAVDGGREPTPEVEDTVDRAVLVIDELASNALRHGAPPAGLLLWAADDRWTVVVSDSAPDRAPTPARDRHRATSPGTARKSSRGRSRSPGNGPCLLFLCRADRM